MAENATIGALRVVLGADTASFEDGLKAAEGRLSSFAANMGKFGAIAGTAIGAALVGVGVAIQHAIDQADELGKAAQKIGVPIEQLSKLKYAADLSGLSLDDLSTGLGKLAKNMSLAAGGSDQAQKGFDAIGVSVRGAGGELRPVSDVVADIAGKFENMKDGAGKTALAMEVFGKSGKDLIPLLNSGATGLKEMYQEAEQLGLVISEKTFKAAEAFNDNLTRLGRVKEGLALTVMAQLVPALQTLSGMLVEAAKNSGALSQAGEQAQAALATMTTTALYAITGLKGLADVLNKINEAAQLLGQGELTKAGDAISQLWTIGAEIAQKFSEVTEVSKKLNDGWKSLGESALGLAGKTEAPVLAAKNFQKALDDLKIKTIELQGGFAALAPGFVAQAISLNVMEASAAKYGMTTAILTQQQLQLNTAMLAFRGAQITEENLLPWDKLQKQLVELNIQLAAGNISFQTFTLAAQKAADSAGMSFKVASESISQSFVEIANSTGGSMSKVAKIAQITAATVAFVNALSAQSYALAGPFPANLVALALVAAKGAAIAAAIKSYNTPTFAAGGSFMVPGGSSGVDNRLMTLGLAAGEQVDITPANGKRASGGLTVVRIEGLDKPRYSLDEVKSILDVAGQAIKDGYKFEVA